MSLNIHIPATQHAVQSCCAGSAATARQTWCALSLLRHHQGRPGVLIFPEHAWSAFLLRRSPHKKTAQSCGPRLLQTAAPVCDPALFSLARLRIGVKTHAIFPCSASHRSAVLMCRLRGSIRANLVCSITTTASGQTSCALSLRHHQGRPRVLYHYGIIRADLVCSIPAAASGQTSCALSLKHHQGRPLVLYH